MSKFRAYDPKQVWLLLPGVADVLGEQHLSLFVHQMVERLDTSCAGDSQQAAVGTPVTLDALQQRLKQIPRQLKPAPQDRSREAVGDRPGQPLLTRAA